MAITPEEILDNTTDYEKNYADILEQEIDKFLKVTFQGTAVSFEISNRNLPLNVLQELRNRYKKWDLTVRHTTDNKAFIHFRPRR